MDDLKLEEQ